MREGLKGFKLCEWVSGSLSASLNDRRMNRGTLNSNIWETAHPETCISLLAPKGGVLLDAYDFVSLYLRD